MKHFFWLLALLSLQVKGQMSMTVQLPPSGVMQKSQLWNMLLVSASGGAVSVRVELRITDARTNQPVLTGISRSIVLNKGAKQIQLGDVMPVAYEYLSMAVDRSPNGLLSAGTYLACYSVIQQTGDAAKLVAEDCLPFAVEPVSPPLLNTPADQSIEEGNLPQFTWLPPAPLTIFNDLNYDMVMVELRKGQSAAEAIQQNIPVFRSLHNRNTFVSYPVSAIALDTAKRYAWTVTANNGNQFAAQTDIWTFRIKGVQVVKAQVTEDAFIQLRKELDGTVFACRGKLQCSYNNLAGDTTVKYEILTLDGKNEIKKHGVLSLKAGENLLQVLPGRNTLADKEHYLFRLYNSRQEYWYLKFIYSANQQ
ncbi:hypothetical protein SAMN05518672_11214 [Chitinophaga sp. CF118]|uniref:hypothetical protein n=1 Tax=Chitinophaga sp. CF118 TaxID=1884367 RepID=UPI0008F18211|nr:hypothetical protein [Chitinophaga sp. CF118]SFE90976.1 hypothetical protein SAMN05518672_11214 [Chitinophaga sp. CF118]